MAGQFLVGLVRQPGGGVVSAGRQGPIPVDGTVWSLSGDRPGGRRRPGTRSAGRHAHGPA